MNLSQAAAAAALAAIGALLNSGTAVMSDGGPAVSAVAISTGQAGANKAVGMILTAGTGMSSDGYVLTVTVDTQAGLHLKRRARVFVEPV